MKKFLVHVIYMIMMQLCGSLPPELMSADPKFTAPISNITVPVGREGVLTCTVHDLIPYKVAWLRVDTQTILTIQNHVITKNHRIGASHTENRIWYLKIRDIKVSDQGWYMCQINTDPMKSQVGYLDVVIPPDIVDYQTSHDMTVQEGQNVTLTCTAAGLPDPTIDWRREEKKPLFSIGTKKVFSVKGPQLMLKNVTRHHIGPYLCIASNGVPPTISKRIMLVVNFAPTISVMREIFYASFGQKIELECITESNPMSVNYWLHGKEYVTGGTYQSLAAENVFQVIMRYVVIINDTSSFGAYKCIAKTSLGTAERILYIHPRSKALESQSYHPASQIGNTNVRNDGSDVGFFSNASTCNSATAATVGTIILNIIILVTMS